MAPVWLSFLLLALLLPSSLGRPQEVSCKFSIPSTNASGSCDTYDLSSIASLGKWPFYDTVKNYSYVFSLCENVPSASLPAPCKNVSQPAVAYQYVNNTNSCYRLGSLDSIYVVS